MKKLDDIPKKDIFKVPDGYFEDLPGIIQARVVKPHASMEVRPVFSYVWRYALAVAVFAAAGTFLFTRESKQQSPESILASINTEDLVAYINDGDITTEELLDGVSLDAEDANEIEGEVYELDETNFDAILDAID